MYDYAVSGTGSAVADGAFTAAGACFGAEVCFAGKPLGFGEAAGVEAGKVGSGAEDTEGDFSGLLFSEATPECVFP